MKVRFLGTGTSVPSLKRLSSSYLVSTERQRFLVDVGPSVVRRLLEEGFTVDDVDGVMITHFHVDHTADLSTFLFACNYGATVRRKPLAIVGGQGIVRFFRGLKAVYPWIAPKSYRLTLHSLPTGSLEVEGATIETTRVNHRRESIAVKITEKGKSVVFSGDTAYSRNLERIAGGVDLLVAECAFPHRNSEGHSNLTVVEKMVSRAQPRRVILTHLYPEWDDYPGVLHTPCLLGEDGMEMEV
jgi:ribonuclease BN (tRNA processing enzyme)